MNRPLVLVTVCFLLGIALGHLSENHLQAGVGPRPLGFACLGIATLGLLLSDLLGRSPRTSLVLGVFLPFVSLGLGRCLLEPAPPRRSHRDDSSARLVEVTGRLESLSSRFRGRELDGTQRVHSGFTLGLDPGPFPSSAPIRVVVRGTPRLLPGDRVRIRGRLLPPATLRNPGQSSSNLPETRLLTCDPSHVEKIGESLSLSPLRFAGFIRERGIRLFEETTGETRSSLLCALVLGERSLVPPTTRDLLRKTGTAHLFAISGLHVGILMLLFRKLFRAFRIPPGGQALLLGLGLILFALATGARPPVLRAGLMACAFLIAPLLRRRPDPLCSLAFAGLILLAFDPDLLLEAGFQLSFVAFLPWLILSETRREAKLDNPGARADSPAPGVRRFLRAFRSAGRTFSLGALAWLATAPLVAFHFHVIAPAAPFSNSVAIPVVTLALALAIPGLALGILGVESTVHPHLLNSSGALLEFLLEGLESTGLDHSAFEVLGPTPIGVAFCFGILLPGLLNLRWLFPAVVLELVILTITSVSPGVSSREPRSVVTVLDVGHGLATVLETPDLGVWVYDCGSRNPGAAARAVSEYLWSRRISAIDTLVLSHGDADHISGARDLLPRFRVGRLLVTPRFGASRTAERRVLEFANLHGIPVERAEAGRRYEGHTGSIVILGPPPEREAPRFHRCTVPGSNEDSLVLRLEEGECSLVLTGDVEGPGLWHLATRREGLPCDLLLVPHHGSPDPGLATLLETAQPHVLLISGKARTTRRDAEMGSSTIPSTLRKTATTGEGGAIQITMNRSSFGVKSFSPPNVSGHTNSMAERFTQH